LIYYKDENSSTCLRVKLFIKVYAFSVESKKIWAKSIVKQTLGWI